MHHQANAGVCGEPGGVRAASPRGDRARPDEPIQRRLRPGRSTLASPNSASVWPSSITASTCSSFMPRGDKVEMWPRRVQTAVMCAGCRGPSSGTRLLFSGLAVHVSVVKETGYSIVDQHFAVETIDRRLDRRFPSDLLMSAAHWISSNRMMGRRHPPQAARLASYLDISGCQYPLIRKFRGVRVTWRWLSPVGGGECSNLFQARPCTSIGPAPVAKTGGPPSPSTLDLIQQSVDAIHPLADFFGRPQPLMAAGSREWTGLKN